MLSKRGHAKQNGYNSNTSKPQGENNANAGEGSQVGYVAVD